MVSQWKCIKYFMNTKKKTSYILYEKGILTGTQRESAISLLLKQEPSGKYKEPVYLKNRRPLTLHGYDSNILAKCIATWIKKP